MHDRRPWDVEPKLTQERLLLLMDVIVRQRKELQPLYTKGDSPWSHGCRAYAWIMDGFEQLEADLCARGETWLRVGRSNNFFNLWIEGVLLRMYRGDPEKPNERTLRIGQQLQGRLPGILIDSNEEATAEWVWMLSYESAPMPWSAKDVTQADGLVIAVSICQARSAASASQEAETRNGWTQPIGIGDAGLAAVTDKLAPPFEPTAPMVTIPTAGKRKKKKEDDDGGSA